MLTPTELTISGCKVTFIIKNIVIANRYYKW